MDETGFSHLAELVRRRSGMALAASRPEVISHRLAPVMRTFGFKDTSTLLAALAYPHEELASAVTEVMTVPDTCFFRDQDVFDVLETRLLPALIANRQEKKRLRLWSAACATGQEAYSLAMILEELELAANGWAVELLATDLSGEALKRARNGFFTDYEADGLPVARQSRHLVRDGEGWRVSERLRRSVTFRRFNLLDDFGWLGEVNLILCRNVLMYFDQRARSAVLRKISDALAIDGVLVVGARESSLGPCFASAQGLRGVFTKKRRKVPRAMRATG